MNHGVAPSKPPPSLSSLLINEIQAAELDGKKQAIALMSQRNEERNQQAVLTVIGMANFSGGK